MADQFAMNITTPEELTLLRSCVAATERAIDILDAVECCVTDGTMAAVRCTGRALEGYLEGTNKERYANGGFFGYYEPTTVEEFAAICGVSADPLKIDSVEDIL